MVARPVVAPPAFASRSPTPVFQSLTSSKGLLLKGAAWRGDAGRYQWGANVECEPRALLNVFRELVAKGVVVACNIDSE